MTTQYPAATFACRIPCACTFVEEPSRGRLVCMVTWCRDSIGRSASSPLSSSYLDLSCSTVWWDTEWALTESNWWGNALGLSYETLCAWWPRQKVPLYFGSIPTDQTIADSGRYLGQMTGANWYLRWSECPSSVPDCTVAWLDYRHHLDWECS